MIEPWMTSESVGESWVSVGIFAVWSIAVWIVAEWRQSREGRRRLDRSITNEQGHPCRAGRIVHKTGHGAYLLIHDGYFRSMIREQQIRDVWSKAEREAHRHAVETGKENGECCREEWTEMERETFRKHGVLTI